MARVQYKAKLTQNRELTPTVRELTIDFVDPAEMPFEAGQFLMLHVPQGEKPVKRAYSIASTDKIRNKVTLILKLVPGGIASEYVRNLTTGAELEMTGPFGKLTLHKPPTEQLLFLCTGAGISQHICFLESMAEEFKGRRMRMLFGVWNEDETFYSDRLDKLVETLPDFSYEFVLDKSIRDWSGKTGFVTNYIAEFDYHNIETTFYLCGNPAMIKGMKAKLEEEGFPKERIFAEAFN